MQNFFQIIFSFFCYNILTDKICVNHHFFMKRTILFLPFFFTALLSFSQIQVKGTYTTYKEAVGLDNIYIFSKIDNSSEIHYTSKNEASVVKWYSFLNGMKTELTNVSTLSATETYIDPANNMGYIVSVDGVETSRFWVFDYSQYLPGINSMLASDGEIPCENIVLNLAGNVPEFSYQNTGGGIFKIDRFFDIIYNTLEWDKDKKDWKTIEKTENVILPRPVISVPTPFTNTVFTVKGDQFASLLGLVEQTVVTPEYETKAVKCNITSITSIREAKNENERPDNETKLEGSAPLDIQFYSNPTPNVNSYFWTIYKNNEKIVARSEKDHIYTFSEAGNYDIKLIVSNGICTDSSSVKVVVSTSSIFAPSIFTPNNDEFNDEFRVAYRSIVEFSCTVYNRWGRIVYSWTDPAKGWDGKINGKNAAEGTYFYIINAKGSDDKVYKLKGHINLLR